MVKIFSSREKSIKQKVNLLSTPDFQVPRLPPQKQPMVMVSFRNSPYQIHPSHFFLSMNILNITLKTLSFIKLNDISWRYFQISIYRTFTSFSQLHTIPLYTSPSLVLCGRHLGCIQPFAITGKATQM